ncbi:hypothetical protein B0T16DRAFT_400392 [Cercophora newfieldiana]|uniref:Uncharacterized protein n=1 Tax=Cercophora newfieldiana TaxID=92897 RepID=A0AA39YQL6_9PEZI|nr:hypothetical protein B0T16DRAFT_400392 [Cercophora newfieldiana]
MGFGLLRIRSGELVSTRVRPVPAKPAREAPYRKMSSLKPQASSRPRTSPRVSLHPTEKRCYNERLE